MAAHADIGRWRRSVASHALGSLAWVSGFTALVAWCSNRDDAGWIHDLAAHKVSGVLFEGVLMREHVVRKLGIVK